MSRWSVLLRAAAALVAVLATGCSGSTAPERPAPGLVTTTPTGALPLPAIAAPQTIVDAVRGYYGAVSAAATTGVTQQLQAARHRELSVPLGDRLHRGDL